MTWRTHVAVGTNAIWLAGIFWQVDQTILVYLPTAIIASILPDIDASAAKIHYLGGGALGILKGSFHGKYFHHRGIMHSLTAVFILYVILRFIFHNSFPALPAIFTVSYLSHCVIDGFNTGVGYFYPFIYKKFALLPKPLLARVGS
ncbi:MAG: metal-dependent hydrolase, partial [Candidatus Doudnabacteria bacterium]|nr:metal-dependent hydrolase [Candidatus Doudnabacteria bacterium]